MVEKSSHQAAMRSVTGCLAALATSLEFAFVDFVTVVEPITQNVPSVHHPYCHV